MAADTPVRVTRVLVYPVKALDGTSVERATARRGGGLDGDRRYALVDADEVFVNGKTRAAIHGVRATHDLAQGTVALTVAGFDDPPALFHLEEDGARFAEWFSDYLGERVRLVSDAARGLPDDPVCSGPTVVAEETLAAVASWFEGLSVEDVRRRFRANIELGGGGAFHEDRLCRADRQPVPLHLGEAILAGIQPCVRCVVPTRSPEDGAPTARFQARFEAGREASMPGFVDRAVFRTLYSLTLNTLVERGGGIAVGDRLLAG